MPYRKEYEDIDRVEIVNDALALNRDNMLTNKEQNKVYMILNRHITFL